MYRQIVILVLYSFIGVARADDGPDRCRDILLYAAHNQNQSLSIGNMATDVKSALCSSHDDSELSAENKGGGISVFGFGSGSASFGQQNIHNIKNNSCSSGESSLNKDNLDKVLSDIVDHTAVEAWRKCTENGGSGLVGTIERLSSSAIVRLRWFARLGVDKTKILNVDTDGIICSGDLWPKDTIVNSVQLSRQCKIDGTSDIAITVQTDVDSVSLFSPAPAPIVPKADPAKQKLSAREECFLGDSDQCKAISENYKKNCGIDRICSENVNTYNNIATSAEAVVEKCAQNTSSISCVEAQKRKDFYVNIAKGDAPPPLIVPPGIIIPHSGK